VRFGAAVASFALVPMGSFVAPVFLVPALTAILIAQIVIELHLARQPSRGDAKQTRPKLTATRSPTLALAQANRES